MFRPSRTASVRLSTAFPYIQIPLSKPLETIFASGIGEEVMSSLEEKQLGCVRDNASYLIVCNKTGIKDGDFFDLKLKLGTATYTVPARELVEIVPLAPPTLFLDFRGQVDGL